MKILLAGPRGFCAGVVRAIAIVERALERFGPPIYVRHEIVHNRHIVERLRAKGVVFVDDPADAPAGALLVFSAHGVSPEVRRRAADAGLRTIDATCPLVTKVHREAERFARSEHELLLVGHAGHVEVEGTLGHAPERIQLVETAEDARRVEVGNPERVGLLTQTTLSVDDTREVVEILRERFPELAAPRKDDICYATQNRQNAVKALASDAGVILVVGAPESSNTSRLVEVARGAGARAYRIQCADELDPAWLEGADCVGITAGAATPEELVTELVDRLCQLAGGRVDVEERSVALESVSFALPPELR